MAADSDRKRPSSVLVGRWFHSFHDGGHPIRWQGQIVEAVSAEVFLAELYDWITGHPSTAVLVPLAHMTDWTFYPTHVAMKESARRRNRREARHG